MMFSPLVKAKRIKLKLKDVNDSKNDYPRLVEGDERRFV